VRSFYDKNPPLIKKRNVAEKIALISLFEEEEIGVFFSIAYIMDPIN